MTYVHNMPPPSTDPTDLELTGELADTIGSFSEDPAGPLVHQGSLETQYYTVNLYRLNGDVLGKARFYPSQGCLFIDNADLYAANTLLEIYRELSPEVTSGGVPPDNRGRGGGRGIPRSRVPEQRRHMASVPVSRRSPPGAPDNPAAVQVLEKQAAERTAGWSPPGRQPGFPGSGLNMAVADAGAVRDNYLSLPFVIEQDDNWAFNIEYFSDRDTGTLEVLVDGQRLAIFDTYGRHPSVKNRSLDMELEAGPHELKGSSAAGPCRSWPGSMKACGLRWAGYPCLA